MFNKYVSVDEAIFIMSFIFGVACGGLGLIIFAQMIRGFGLFLLGFGCAFIYLVGITIRVSSKEDEKVGEEKD